MKIDDALHVLRRLGLDYRPDTRVAADAWIAHCPRCRPYHGPEAFPLTLRADAHTRRVSGACRHCGTLAIAYLGAALHPKTPEQRLHALELRQAVLEIELSTLTAQLRSVVEQQQ